jgi:hypothetical protein
MEAYSKHLIVRKANAPGEVVGVGEFLNHVRRMMTAVLMPVPNASTAASPQAALLPSAWPTSTTRSNWPSPP